MEKIIISRKLGIEMEKRVTLNHISKYFSIKKENKFYELKVGKARIIRVNLPFILDVDIAKMLIRIASFS